MTYTNTTKLTDVILPSYIELLWNDMLDKTTDNVFIIYCFGMHVLMAIIYWSVGSFYVYLDLYNPKWVRKFKIQPGKNEPVDRKELKKVLLKVVYNQIILGPYLTLISSPIMILFGMDSIEKIRTVPHLHTIVTQIAGCIVVREVLFYYSHRLLHSRLFYERHHKKHHRWTAPVAVSAQYADEFEHLVSNLAPTMIPVALLRCHLFTILIFYTHVIFRTLSDHSGYKFPYYYNPVRHDKHHESFNQYYGIIGLMDWVHGTNKLKRTEKKGQ